MLYFVVSSFRYLSIDTPEIKKMPPKIAMAHGLKDTKLFPKMPKTPRIRAIIPPMVSINASTLIIIFVFYRLDYGLGVSIFDLKIKPI